MRPERPPYLEFDPADRRLRLDPHEPRFFQNPHEAYAWLHAEGGTFFWEDFGFWCFGGFDAVSGLLRERRLGRERPGGYMASVTAAGERAHLARFDALEAYSLLELEPPAHTRLRSLVNRAFVSRQIERLRPTIEALADTADRPADVGRRRSISSPAFATPLPATVIAEMMGVPVAHAPQLVAWSNDMVRMYMHRPSAADARRADESSAQFAAFIRDHAARRRAAPGDDLLSVLVSANAQGERLSEAELVSSAVLLLNAGHEATVHQTGNAIRAILGAGGEPGRFFEDSRAVEATVEECLRFDAPLHHVHASRLRGVRA